MIKTAPQPEIECIVVLRHPKLHPRHHYDICAFRSYHVPKVLSLGANTLSCAPCSRGNTPDCQKHSSTCQGRCLMGVTQSTSSRMRSISLIFRICFYKIQHLSFSLDYAQTNARCLKIEFVSCTGCITQICQVTCT